MFATLLAAVALIVPALAQCTGFVLDTPPSLNQCSNTQITWTAGNSPFWLLALNPSDPCGDAITDYGTHAGWSMTIYNATYVKGQPIELSLVDVNDCEVWTGAITVGDGPTDCLNATQLAEYHAGGAAAGANNAEGAPSTTGSSKPVSTSKSPSLAGAVANGSNGATMATFSLPVLALSAAAGIFALL